MAKWYQKNSVTRKSIALLKQAPRLINRITYSEEDFWCYPPLIANSFPKSGTHLLLQILESIPGTKSYGTFIASMPSLTFRERSEKQHLRLIGKLVPGEVAAAHLFYSSAYQAGLTKNNCAHFFIYRDPRDVAISEAHYLTSMNRFHRMHKYFTKVCKNLDERVTTSILGVTESDFPYTFPNISERFKRYQGWLDDPNVYSVKYEDLISDQRPKILKEMVDFYNQHCEQKLEIDETVCRMEAGIDPKKSHTFRKGKSGGWKSDFTDEHKRQMKGVAGELLIQLGYETSLNW